MIPLPAWTRTESLSLSPVSSASAAPEPPAAAYSMGTLSGHSSDIASYRPYNDQKPAFFGNQHYAHYTFIPPCHCCAERRTDAKHGSRRFCLEAALLYSIWTNLKMASMALKLFKGKKGLDPKAPITSFRLPPNLLAPTYDILYFVATLKVSIFGMSLGSGPNFSWYSIITVGIARRAQNMDFCKINSAAVYRC